MAALKLALTALGWETPRAQAAMVQLLALCGKAEELMPDAAHSYAMPGQHQARAIAENATLFSSDAAALSWLRDATQELFYSRQDYAAQEESTWLAENRETVLSLLDTLGMTGERRPNHAAYDILLVPGGNEAWAKLRMDHATALLEGGMQPQHVVLLGSNRMLMPEMERDSLIALLGDRLAEAGTAWDAPRIAQVLDEAVNHPVLADIEDIYARNTAQAKHVMAQTGLRFRQWPTEADLMEWLYEEHMQGLPPEQRRHQSHTVSSPMVCTRTGAGVQENTPDTIQQLLDGELRRANTQDTFRDFAALAIAGEGAKVVSVSHQPYALHQHGQLLAALPETAFAALDTIAAASPPEEVNLHHALGCMAKYVYAMHDKAQARLAEREQQPQRA